MDLQIFDTGRQSATDNMKIDLELLLGLSADSSPTLHFYDWLHPSVTFGYFTDPYALLNAKAIQKHQLELAKRPTGGGLLFHLFDFAFSFLLPASHPAFSLNTLENYHFVNTTIVDALQNLISTNSLPELHRCSSTCPSKDSVKNLQDKFCMAGPTVYDVVIDGKKLAGAAQRRTKQGYLHQASIALTLPPIPFLKDLLNPKSEVVKAMEECGYPLLNHSKLPENLDAAKEIIKSTLVKSFSRKCSTGV